LLLLWEIGWSELATFVVAVSGCCYSDARWQLLVDVATLVVASPEFGLSPLGNWLVVVAGVWVIPVGKLAGRRRRSLGYPRWGIGWSELATFVVAASGCCYSDARWQHLVVAATLVNAEDQTGDAMPTADLALPEI
jgi:hypothetical protein